MKATYQNNFKNVKKHLDINRGHHLIVDLRNDHFHNIPHAHTKYSMGVWSEEYYSRLNHINLFQVIDPSQLIHLPFALIRDGLFTLIDFFNRFPTPKGFSSTLIIHEKFQDYIPSKWNDSVLFYDFEINHDVFSSKTFSNELIIKGHIMNGIFDNDYLISFIKEIVTEKRIKKILLCLVPRENYFLNKEWQSDNDFSNISNNLMKSIYQDIPKSIEIEFINWKIFFSLQNVHKFEFWDANKKDLLYIDDQSDFYLLKKGAKPYWIEKSSPRFSTDDLIVPLTHSHSIRILKSTTPTRINHWLFLDGIFKLLEIKKGEKLNYSAFEAIQKLSGL